MYLQIILQSVVNLNAEIIGEINVIEVESKYWALITLSRESAVPKPMCRSNKNFVLREPEPKSVVPLNCAERDGGLDFNKSFNLVPVRLYY